MLSLPSKRNKKHGQGFNKAASDQQKSTCVSKHKSRTPQTREEAEKKLGTFLRLNLP
jgi:hypothetical protein